MAVWIGVRVGSQRNKRQLTCEGFCFVRLKGSYEVPSNICWELDHSSGRTVTGGTDTNDARSGPYLPIPGHSSRRSRAGQAHDMQECPMQVYTSIQRPGVAS